MRRMPSALFDTDEKYKKLLSSYLRVHSDNLNFQNDTNNNNESLINCKIFDNILESLIWLTKNGDDNLTKQLCTNTKQLKGLQTAETPDQKINVLITGSLYLVGLSLKVLNFKMN